MARVTTAKRGLWGRFGFVGDIISELRKVIWPTRQELVRLTLMVLAVCIIASAILSLCDWGFTELVSNVFMRGIEGT